METDVKLTKLAGCAGCGAKVGAGTLTKLLEGFKTHTDERLIVGYDKSDDASVFKLSDDIAIVSTTDFFPPIVDDPYLFGQIAATNALSDVYAMGGEPKLALNLMCITENMEQDTVKEILRGGYDKAYEAGTIITGGHTIHGAEPFYGLAVTGFVHPDKVLTNSAARPSDVLILTKPLGVGVIMTAAKGGMVEDEKLLNRIYAQMATLNKYARDIMVKYEVHSCTDVTGFSLLGHSYEMAQGSNCNIVLDTGRLPIHAAAYEYADMGFVPAGAYRNRSFAEKGVSLSDIFCAKYNEKTAVTARTMLDILYDPQTSGGLLISVAKKDAARLIDELHAGNVSDACEIGYVEEVGYSDNAGVHALPCVKLV